VGIAILVAVASAVFAFAMRDSYSSSSVLVAGLWGILFFPTLLLCICYVSTYFTAKSFFKNNINLRKPMHYSFSEDLVVQEMATGRAELQWATFLKVRETKDLLLFFVQKQLAYVVPKRALESEKDIAAARDLIRRHVADAALHGQ
jgi:YcxB-like protein